MSNYQELIHEEKFLGFDIKVYMLPEDHQPDWDFESEADRVETLDKIERGDLLWFIAKVTVSRMDVELAHDYLGGLCYKTIKEFIACETYESMREETMRNARLKLSELRGEV